MVPQERLSAAADPMKVNVILQANPRDLPWSQVIRLGAGKLKSEHEHNLHGLRPLSCCPPSTVQPSSQRCQNLVSQGSHCAAQIAASCGHAVLAASTLGECQTNLHAYESQCKHLQTNRTVLQSPASDRRKQNTCFKAVHEEVGWGQQQHARAILLSLRRPPCSWLGAGNQHAVLERKDGEICSLCYIAYRSKPILQRAETSSSKFPLTIKLLLSSMEAAAFVVVACAYAAFTVRRHLLVSNALGKARHAQFWSCPNFSQTYLVADLAQATSPRCAEAPGQQISVVANVLAEHEFVQAVGDWLSFWSVDEDQPPILLLLFSLRSFAVLHASRCYRKQLWAPVQAPPSHAPHPVFVHARTNFSVWMVLVSQAQTPARSQLCQLR